VRAAKIVSNTFAESDFSTDLGRLQSLSDGYMDEDINNFRAAVGADAVILVTSDAQVSNSPHPLTLIPTITSHPYPLTP
jgi:hypothetical protein